MKSRWSDAEVTQLARELHAAGVPGELAERVYTSRLLGQDPRLALHGGGNTSWKTHATDPLLGGEPFEVIHVKGSGWDLATIGAKGLPAVRLEPLRHLRTRQELADEPMVNFLRGNLLENDAPTPSVETLLHAFLPHAVVDHTHALAILALADQPDGERLVREVFGPRLACVPYVMPGFALAKLAAEVFERDPKVEGLVLLKHGLFTFGATARESYERTVEFVTLAEEHVARAADHRPRVATSPSIAVAPLAEVAPVVRGALANAATATGANGAAPAARWVLNFRTGPDIRRLLDDTELPRFAAAGPATPDHIIRTKALPLVLGRPAAGGLEAFAVSAHEAVGRFAADYRAYFERHNPRHGGVKKPLDPTPRVVLVPGLGLFGVGPSARDAAVVADLAETWVETVLHAECVGRFEPIGESDQFDMEYWSLEQAKLGGRGAEKPLARQVLVVTGGAGGHRASHRPRVRRGGRGGRAAGPKRRAGHGRGARGGFPRAGRRRRRDEPRGGAGGLRPGV